MGKGPALKESALRWARVHVIEYLKGLFGSQPLANSPVS